MIYCGIDPGKRGAIVVLDQKGLVLRKELLVDTSNFIRITEELLDQVAKEEFVIGLEKAQPFKGEGGCSTFTYADGFGELKGVLRKSRLGFTLVPPVTWTKAMHAGIQDDTPKKRSLKAAQNLFPGVSFVMPGCRNPHDGIVDALLIAEYMRRSRTATVNMLC